MSIFFSSFFFSFCSCFADSFFCLSFIYLFIYMCCKIILPPPSVGMQLSSCFILSALSDLWRETGGIQRGTKESCLISDHAVTVSIWQLSVSLGVSISKFSIPHAHAPVSCLRRMHVQLAMTSYAPLTQFHVPSAKAVCGIDNLYIYIPVDKRKEEW